jgi:hypothetical protein
MHNMTMLNHLVPKLQLGNADEISVKIFDAPHARPSSSLGARLKKLKPLRAGSPHARMTTPCLIISSIYNT